MVDCGHDLCYYQSLVLEEWLTPSQFEDRFANAVFSYLKLTEMLISRPDATEAVGTLTQFAPSVAKAVAVISACDTGAFYRNVIGYFELHGINKLYVFNYIARYCQDIHEANSDIFAVILNVIALIYRIGLYCLHKGHAEYLAWARMCWCQVFVFFLKKDFYAKGGWFEFLMYVEQGRYIVAKDVDEKSEFNVFLEEINQFLPKLEQSDSQTAPLKKSGAKLK